MFMGEYSHSIDAKGRLIMPVKFREQLGDNFVVTKGFDKCLYVYTNEEWKNFDSKLSQIPINGKEARQIERFFYSGAAECEVDKQGRILLPSALREYAKLDKDVVLIGVSDRIEIWNSERYMNDIHEYEENIDDIAERMGELGFRF